MRACVCVCVCVREELGACERERDREIARAESVRACESMLFSLETTRVIRGALVDTGLAQFLLTDPWHMLVLTIIAEYGLTFVKPALSWIQLHNGRRALEVPQWLRDRCTDVEEMKKNPRVFFPESFALADVSVQRHYRFVIPLVFESD